MKSLMASLFSAFLALGCGGSQSSASESSASQSGSTGQSEDPNAPVASCVAPGESPSAETCGFVTNGCCYATAALACQAAGCGEDTCTVLETFPARVHCP